LVNKIKNRFADKEATLEDRIPMVIMEIKTCLLKEANQLLTFNGEMGTCKTPETDLIPCSKDAVQILREANIAAENSIRDRFPSIPDTHPQRLGIKF